MATISFHQGVALAFGAFIDPSNSVNNQTFTLVEETANRNVNGKFAINISNGKVDNRLNAIFHGRAAGGGDIGQLNFTNNSAGTALGDLPSQLYLRATSSTATTDTDLTSKDDVFTGYNASEKQLDYRAGGDITGDSSVSKPERNYHRTGLAIWNKLKK